MPHPHEFLIVDHHRDNRFLLTKTLLRRYPQAKIYEPEDSPEALSIVKEKNLAAAIIHRAGDVDGIFLIRMLREAAPKLPILAISGFDRREQALAAGANAFMHYDAWLSLGRVVEELLSTGDTPNPFQALTAERMDGVRADADSRLFDPLNTVEVVSIRAPKKSA
jgi:CheY-like chemotaxis protein